MKITGVGNALVDVIVNIPSQELLDRLALPLGSMTLIDLETHDAIMAEISSLTKHYSTGGSAANSMNGLAKLGCKPYFIGKVARDEAGVFFAQDQVDSGIEERLIRTDDLPTGKCISLVLPCGERTMATYLGAACTMLEQEVEIPECDLVYIEGYLLQSHHLIGGIMTKAKAAGAKVALDLASYNVVEENLDKLNELIDKYVDILFANEQEAQIFSGGLPAEQALEMMVGRCSTAIVKIGARGALIARGTERCHVDIVDAVVRDKTGAGDMFAAGFLYGMSRNLDLKSSGDIGSLLSGRVIEVAGAKIPQDKWEEILKKL